MINRTFTLIWIGQALSDVASEMTSLALPLAVLATTRSPVDASLVATVVGVAQLLAKLPAGLVADTFNRRTLMLLCDGGRAVVALGLAAALAWGRLTTGMAVGAAAATAVMSSVFSPAEAGVLRQAVPVERRREAVTRTIVRSNIAIAVGPPLGGALLAAGASLAFVVDGCSYVLSLLLVAQVGYRHVTHGAAAPAVASGAAGQSRQGPAAGGWKSAAAELTAGFGWVFRRRGLLLLVVFVAYVNVLGRAVELLASFGVSHDGARPVSAGLVLTAAGVGGIAGGLCTGWLLRVLRPGAVLVGVALAWLVFMPLASSGEALLSVVAVGLVVFLLPPIGSLVFLTVSVEAPAGLQGRIGGAIALMAVSVAWMGPGLTGLLVAGWGPLATSVVLAAPMAVPVVAMAVSGRLRSVVASVGRVPAPEEASEKGDSRSGAPPARVSTGATGEEPEVMAHLAVASPARAGSTGGEDAGPDGVWPGPRGMVSLGLGRGYRW
jgi:predicted MFS family arabinose efflux permease